MHSTKLTVNFALRAVPGTKLTIGSHTPPSTLRARGHGMRLRSAPQSEFHLGLFPHDGASSTQLHEGDVKVQVGVLHERDGVGLNGSAQY